MKAFLAGALAATLAGCSCILPPQASIEGCTDANRLACLDRMAASQPIEPEFASFKTDSAAVEIKSAIAPRTERPSPAPAHRDVKTAKLTVPPPKVELAASRIPLPPPSLHRGLEPVAAAVENHEAAATQAPQPKANGKERSKTETVGRGRAGEVAPAPPNERTVGSVQNQPAETAWIVSETTSPVDYSPLITAAIHSTSSVKDAPDTLAVRCHGARSELQLRTEGAWQASRAGDVQVDHQINDQPIVRLPWKLSADGKTASYKGDPAGFLGSLTEGARLKIRVFDGERRGQEATFQLTGLDRVRNKVGLACKWPS